MAISNRDLNIKAAAGLRVDRAYNPEAGTLTYGGYNTLPQSAPAAVSAVSAAAKTPRIDVSYNPETGTSNGAWTGTGANGGAMTGGGSNVMTQPRNDAANGGMLGVRNAMIGAGFDNDKIGWNNGKVTYNGADFLTPASVTDGVSYASQADIDKAIKGYMGSQGLSGIREMLVSRGVDDSRIGWNSATGNVTIDGRDAFKPENIIGDRSYAGARDINALTNKAYENIGDPIVQATGAGALTGLQNLVTWSDGKLMVGGNQVDVMYVDADGKAYAKQSDIEKAIARVREQTGITGNKEVYDNWRKDYGDRIDAALDPILNRTAWDYDPYDDPAFLAYRDAYTREGNRAYQDAYASMAANTGGYGSSAGMTAAGQQLNYYMQQLGDRIPELEQNSYNRWYNDQQLNRAALESLMSAADSDYNKAYQANRDAINDTNNANYYNYLRDSDAEKFNRDVEVQDREWALDKQLKEDAVTQSHIDTANYERLSQLGLRQAELEVEAQEIANHMDRMTDIVTKYAFSGDVNTQISPDDAAALGIKPKSDGTYPTIMDVQVAYTLLENAQTTPYYTQTTQQMQREVMEKQRQQQMAAAAVLQKGVQAVVGSGAFGADVTSNVAATAANAQEMISKLAGQA